MKRITFETSSLGMMALVAIGLSLLFVFTGEYGYASGQKKEVSAVPDAGYTIEELVPGCQFHGIHGLTFDNRDNLYVGSIMGLAVYKVNPVSGEVEAFINPPFGMADDMEFGPDGSLYYTAPFMGKLFRRDPDGKVTVLAAGLPHINSVALNKEGRLFGAQVNPKHDVLFEFDPSGNKKPRQVAEKLGGLNGFDFGPDGNIYGPQMFKGSVCRVNIDSGKVETIAEGFDLPVALNFDSKGNCYLLTGGGYLYQIDVATGGKREIAKLPGGTDNIALDSKGNLFVTNMADNGIYQVDTKTGEVRTIIEGRLAVPQGISVVSGPDGDEIFLADIFSFRRIDGKSGKVSTIGRPHGTDLAIKWPTSATAFKDNVFLTSQLTGTVQVVDKKTNKSKKIFSGFAKPSRAIQIDDNNFLVAELGTGNLVKVALDDENNRVVVAEKLSAPACIARAGEKAVYVSEAGAGTVSRIDLAGGGKKVIASNLKAPVGLAVLSTNEIVVVDAATKQLIKINPDTGALVPIAGNLPVGLFVSEKNPKLNLLPGVAVGAGDTIYVAGDANNSITKLTPK